MKCIFIELKTKMNLVLLLFCDYCDRYSITDLKADMPQWFDETKFKRGQKYYRENQGGVLKSVIYGLVCLLADPGGLDILHSTGRSSTPETARLRYVETILHQRTWYDFELTKDSKSWKSLNKIRRLHLLASNGSQKNGIGIISQTEIAMTLFTFMGFTVSRPTHFGIYIYNKEGREGFIHFWAVMGYVLGLKDEYNYCLQSLEVCSLVCEIFIRYVFLPYLQFEPPLFKQMLSAVVEGLGTFSQDLKYDSVIYMTRRSCSIPGYQIGVDISKENLVKDVFTKEEICMLRSYVSRSKYAVKNSIRFFPERIHIIEIIKDENNSIEPIYDDEEEQKYQKHIEEYRKELGLKETDQFVIKTISHDDYQSHLCNTKFYDLSFRLKITIRLQLLLFWIGQSYIGCFFTRFVLKRFHGKLWAYYRANSKTSLY